MNKHDYSSSHRLNSSRRAVGAVIDLTKAILANQIGNGAALFRPAGLNAEKDRSLNGEFFNSIAAGAKWIRKGSRSETEIEQGSNKPKL